ncbi:class I SAM-dependent methyltransferase [Fulvivirga sedimenti]|uniref:Class I SAM-dependent methyltransferase n=1 Tax=Fulvivirga sedimenti TaxID=2879465 RepID=A0A9X1KZP2_9BACT|nr:class I SAM-dependent methyltransferase [Fulvivirga sedimenti]MCA6078515.1 class I SAM-dependent methyltransferase [Fulvivirga sedimenti]
MKKSDMICQACGNQSLQHYLTVRDHFLSKEEFDLLHCIHCDMLTTYPVPEDISRYYDSEDYLSHQFTKKNLITALYKFIRDVQVNNKLDLIGSYHSAGSLLDVGCGTGYFLKTAQTNGYHVSGVEINTGARQVAQELIQIPIYASLSDIKESAFDIITLWHVLEHLPKPVTQFQRLHSLLSSKGTLLIAVPNYKSKDAVHYKEYWAGYDVPRHLYHFSQQSIHKLADKTGFIIERVVPMKYDSFYVSLLSERYKNSGPTAYINAFIQGMRSNMSASGSTEYSSLIYVLQKV